MKKTKLIFGNENELPYPPGTLTISQSNNVGYYRLGSGEDGLHFCLTNKPNWFHRKMTKLCLGWEWVDNK